MFDIGSKVITTDGSEHELAHLVIDPKTREVTDLVVEVAGNQRDKRVISVVDVGYVDQDGVRLNMAEGEFARRRSYSVDELQVPTVGSGPTGMRPTDLLWVDPYQGANPELGSRPVPMARVQVTHGIGDRETVVGKGTPVFTQGGRRVGEVDHIAVAPETFEPRAVVIKMPGIRRRRVIVQADDILEWERAAVVLRLARDDLKALPPFSPRRGDDEVEADVRRAIHAADVNVRHLMVQSRQGDALVRGHVGTAEERREADRVARSVPGVLCLTNEITTDRMLQTRVQARLDEDGIAGLYPVEVTVTDGGVQLAGAVPNSAIHHIVRDVVEQTPGVTRVTDAVAERPEDFTAPPVAVRVSSTN